MRKFRILSVLFVLISLGASAQQVKNFTVSAGQSFVDVLSHDELFRYPYFIKGTTVYKDGTTTSERMNYSFVQGEMMFLNSRNDTLVITKKDAISQIILAEDTFYVSNHYYEHLAGGKDAMLLMHKYIKLINVKKEGAYGTSNSTGSVDSYSSLSANKNSATLKLKVNEDMDFALVTDFYFSRKSNEFVLAKKNSILKLFPEEEEIIKEFIKSQSIRFNEKDDLIKLTEYLKNTLK
jgi:hypothetical protein